MGNQYTGVFEQVDNWLTGLVEEIQEILQARREPAPREAEGLEVLRALLAVPVV